MKAPMALIRAVQAIWADKGAVSTLLLPFSWMVNVVVLRRQRHAAKLRQLECSPSVPVVVVGNLYVGGTGKTPVVIALSRGLQAMGWNAGVISRGYGTPAGAAPRVGAAGSVTPAAFGDEPTLIAQSTGLPIAVHPDRRAARDALIRAYPQINVIISDDGLQHWPLDRAYEIIVQDARGVGNGRVLPAGPLREPASRMADVDLIVSNLLPSQSVPALPVPATRAHRITMQLHAVRVRRLTDGATMDWSAWLALHKNRDVSAAAAIGQPDRFFAMLRSQGAKLVDTLALPDHHAYTESPFGALHGELILITEKDAVKCKDLGDTRLWVVEAESTFSDPEWFTDVHHRLRQSAKRISSPAREPLD